MACFVIGDIHGCLDEMRYLLEGLPLQRGDRIVFLGDYIDRGPDSCGVISHLLELQTANDHTMVFLKGNHEDMLLAYLGLGGHYGDMFLYNGGATTLASYGIIDFGAPAAEIAAQLPSSHLQFVANLETFFVIKPFFCVHAGIHPLKSLNQQDESEMLWIRNEFILKPHSLPFTVLFGHTPQSEVFFDLPYKIGLDTGLVYGNKLSCLEVENKVLYQISRGTKTVRELSIKEKWQKVERFFPP